jgi:hypothetical protein
MITQTEALNRLTEAFSRLSQRNDGNLSLDEVEAEVINQACKYIIENYKDQLHSVHDIYMINSVINRNDRFLPIAEAFTQAAHMIFPDNYGQEETIAAINGIRQNIAWSGMWAFLVDYFQKKHGINIDDTIKAPVTFYSTRHIRYENGVEIYDSAKVETRPVKRNINFNFLNNKNKVIVSIEPTLSPKSANLIERAGNKYKYRGDDQDYAFEIHMNRFDMVEKFIFEMPNRNLRIIYLNQ